LLKQAHRTDDLGFAIAFTFMSKTEPLILMAGSTPVQDEQLWQSK
jgi:hypothetical protein